MGKIHTYEQKSKTGEVYVFECEHVYFPELRQTRKVNRRLIGKKDKDGNIIPTRKKTKRPSSEENADYRRLYEKLKKQTEEKDALIASLKAEIQSLQTKYSAMQKTIEKTIGDLAPYSNGA